MCVALCVCERSYFRAERYFDAECGWNDAKNLIEMRALLRIYSGVESLRWDIGGCKRSKSIVNSFINFNCNICQVVQDLIFKIIKNL